MKVGPAAVSVKLLVFCVGCAVGALFLMLIFFPTAGQATRTSFAGQISPTGDQVRQDPTDDTPASSQTLAPAQEVSSGIPIRLKIPEINVDAPLESVGLTAQGAAGVPEDPSDAAWLDAGPRPGEEGSAVIDGHFGWKDGIPAVFDDLSKLHTGDKLYVEDESGATTVFVVREIRTYGADEDASSVFSSTDGRAHLNLITCEGVWNAAQQNYSDRLVVFADKV